MLLCTVVSNYGSLQRFSFFLLNLAEMHHYCNNLNNFLLFSEKLRFTFFLQSLSLSVLPRFVFIRNQELTFMCPKEKASSDSH